VKIIKNNSEQSKNAEMRLGSLARELLDDGAKQLPDRITARLNQARALAITAYPRQEKLATEWIFAGFPRTFSGNWATKMMGALGLAPILALSVSIFAIVGWQEDARIKDIAHVDRAILTDTVPPAAYKDDGYVRYLLTNGKDLIVEEEEDEEEDI
jgi:hypothetical protein